MKKILLGCVLFISGCTYSGNITYYPQPYVYNRPIPRQTCYNYVDYRPFYYYNHVRYARTVRTRCY